MHTNYIWKFHSCINIQSCIIQTEYCSTIELFLLLSLITMDCSKDLWKFLSSFHFSKILEGVWQASHEVDLFYCTQNRGRLLLVGFYNGPSILDSLQLAVLVSHLSKGIVVILSILINFGSKYRLESLRTSWKDCNWVRNTDLYDDSLWWHSGNSIIW